MWFSEIVNATVQFGAVLRYSKSYGRCGSVRFSDIVNPAMRFGASYDLTVRFGEILENRKYYGAVRCGFDKN